MVYFIALVVEPFEAEFSTSSPVGFTIGQLCINKGKSPLTSLTLTGEGADNFQLNSDGTLKLLKKTILPNSYNLIVNAENIYGLTQQNITIEITDTDTLAKAQLGLLINARVKIIKIDTSTNNKELLYLEETSGNVPNTC